LKADFHWFGIKDYFCSKVNVMNTAEQKLELLQWIVNAADEDLLRYLCRIRTVHEQAADWATLLKADELETVYNKLMAIEYDTEKQKNIADKLYEGYL